MNDQQQPYSPPRLRQCAPEELLETFPAPTVETIRFECPEFTCLCPKTGQPDFAQLVIWYGPADKCLELKSLKLYLWSYREQGAFHEEVTRRILGHLVAASSPQWMLLESNFWVRGGIHTVVWASHGQVPAELLVARQAQTEYRGY